MVKSGLKRVIQGSLRPLNLRLVNRGYLDWLERTRVDEEDLFRIAQLSTAHTRELLHVLPHSKAQLRQDLFVLSQLDFRRNGYFVEFGATDGVDGSNTHLLENDYGWSGILAEPARTWHAALARNRRCGIDTRCVWSVSGETVSFNETPEAYYSTVDRFSASDLHREKRREGTSYDVETVSLADLLSSHGAPERIDYLSIDTEGSEFQILSHFDFDRYRFDVITCEHNLTPMREPLHALFSAHGYVRVLESISSVDDWYVDQSLAKL
jgi:FkbM family methyltransferase